MLHLLASTIAAPAVEPAHWHHHDHGHHHHHHHLSSPLLGFAAPSGNASATATAAPFPLSAVSISPGSAFAEAAELNSRYLRYLDLDRLLHTFRTQAGVANPAHAYGGWESPDYQWGLLNGHFTGHLLSALAFAGASGDDPLRAKGTRLVEELAACQDAIAQKQPQLAGWLSAYGIDQLERLEAHNLTHVWAPYYTLHKIMAGLLDQHVQVGNAQALAVLAELADFLSARIGALIAREGEAWWQVCLDTEFGGMNEVAYSLYQLTRQPAHLALASYFSPDAFFAPLAAGATDPLENLHANQHLPIVVGAARGFEVTRNATLANVTANFDCLLRGRYSYPTGGSNVNEHWQFPAQLGDAVAVSFDEATHAPHNSNGFHTQETCTTYNALKLARHLFAWAPSVAVADAYERRLLNGILGVQQPGVVGSMSYMTPLGRGVNRNKWDWYGFGSADSSFWCCYGTTVESFAKLGDSIFFHAADSNADSNAAAAAAPPTLYVAQYIPSTLTWADAAVSVGLAASLQLGAAAGALRAGLAVNLTIAPSGGGAAHFALRVRIPGWAAAGSTVELVRRGGRGGDAATPVANGTFYAVATPTGGWAGGDVVRLWLAMAPRLERINDARDEYATVGSVLLGPLLLAALTNESDVLRADAARPSEWVRLAPSRSGGGGGGPAWNIWDGGGGEGVEEPELDPRLVAVGAAGNYTLVPLSRIALQNYTAFLNVTRARARVVEAAARR